ncbi:iron-siderophore ABC transporter substrate-binding protein [Pseudonocardia oroxyli]|uniref:Iron complex transport system substrate-binding protein n=1 Tax=Pseudonocardia oroxyli TaxID=366584 RepID=A0A1G7W5G7_PSEOR|nr:iron-siderophore ABC transporter substrate-binding protein [Pseudonocardia oroxyli]SDG67234.1 iron complex transport system substrate-binding protein [Pseudonocardia oroxyli]
MSVLSRRSFLGTGALAASALALAACSGGSTTGGGPGGAGYPVTIPHAFGSTTIQSPPQRVATVSAANQDVAIALGVVPVVMPFFEYGGDAEGVLPWVRDALRGKEMPRIAGRALEPVAFEETAAAAPDLILATYSGLDRAQYDTLSRIAPVVAYPDAAYATSWQDQTRIAGRALGRTAEAEQLVVATQARLAAATREYPQLAGATFVYTGGMDSGQLGVFRPTDVRVRLLEDMGLRTAPFVEENAPAGDAVYYTVSGELLPRVQSDLLVGFFGSPDLDAAFRAEPAVATMPAVRADGYAPIVGADRVAASSSPSVLSIPWVLDDYLPILAEAATRSRR